jgi:hypothetical protein
MRGVLVLLLLAGCSSESAAPPDLAAGPVACMFSGDAPDARCYQRFCRQPTSDNLQLYDVLPIGPIAEFALDGQQFTLGRSYTATDLTTFRASFRTFSGPTYAAGSSVAGSTLTLTITDAVQNPGETCGPSGDGTAHGSAHIGLIEVLDADAGARTPGHATVDAVF